MNIKYAARMLHRKVIDDEGYTVGVYCNNLYQIISARSSQRRSIQSYVTLNLRIKYR